MALYDPTPKVVSPDFSVADVLAWARTKPADEAYEYWCDRCALGQFFSDTGRAGRWGGFDTWGDATIHIDGYLAGPFGCTLAATPPTFGALAKRLEALL